MYNICDESNGTNAVKTYDEATEVTITLVIDGTPYYGAISVIAKTEDDKVLFNEEEFDNIFNAIKEAYEQSYKIKCGR